MRSIMVSGYVGIKSGAEPLWLHKILDNHKKFAGIARVDYEFETEPAQILLQARSDLFHQGSASKPFYLKKYLNRGYDYVFWIDPDAFIISPNAYPLGHFDAPLGDPNGSASVTFTGDRNSIYNGGHILIRNTPQAHSIIEEWIRILQFEIPSQTSSELSHYTQLTNNYQNLRGDQTAFNIALTTQVVCPDDLLLGLARSHRRAPRLKIENRFRPPLTYAHCQYISSNIIREDWRHHINVIPQHILNSYPVTSEPKAKYSFDSPHIHYAGASKYFFVNNILLHELIVTSKRWRLLYSLSQVILQVTRLDPLVIYPYLRKILKAIRQTFSINCLPNR